jgi:hypothetical protein
VFLSCGNACLKGGRLAACRFTAGSGRADIFIFGTFRSPVFPPPGCCQVYGRQTKTRLEQSYVFLERKTQRRLTALHVGQTGEPFGFSQDHPRRPSRWADRSRLLNGRHAGQRQSSAPPALERARKLERSPSASLVIRQPLLRDQSHGDCFSDRDSPAFPGVGALR